MSYVRTDRGMSLIDLNIPEAKRSPTDQDRRLSHDKVPVVREVIESHEVQVEVDTSKLVDQKIPAIMNLFLGNLIQFDLSISDLCEAIIVLSLSGLETNLSEMISGESLERAVLPREVLTARLVRLTPKN